MSCAKFKAAADDEDEDEEDDEMGVTRLPLRGECTLSSVTGEPAASARTPAVLLLLVCTICKTSDLLAYRCTAPAAAAAGEGIMPPCPPSANAALPVRDELRLRSS